MSKGEVATSYKFTNAGNIAEVFANKGANARVEFSGAEIDELSNEDWLTRAVDACFMSKDAEIGDDTRSVVFAGNGSEYRITSNANNEIKVEFRLAGETEWREGLPNSRVRVDFIKSLGFKAGEATEEYELSVAKAEADQTRVVRRMFDAFSEGSQDDVLTYVFSDQFESLEIKGKATSENPGEMKVTDADIAAKIARFKEERTFESVRPLLVDLFDREAGSYAHLASRRLERDYERLLARYASLIDNPNATVEDAIDLVSSYANAKQKNDERNFSVSTQVGLFNGNKAQIAKEFFLRPEARTLSQLEELLGSNASRLPTDSLLFSQEYVVDKYPGGYSWGDVLEDVDAIKNQIDALYRETFPDVAPQGRSYTSKMEDLKASPTAAVKLESIESDIKTVADTFADLASQISYEYEKEVSKANREAKAEKKASGGVRDATAKKSASRDPYADIEDVKAEIAGGIAGVKDRVEPEVVQPTQVVPEVSAMHTVDLRPKSAPGRLRTERGENIAATNAENRQRFGALRRAASSVFIAFGKAFGGSKPVATKVPAVVSDDVKESDAANLRALIVKLNDSLATSRPQGVFRISLPTQYRPLVKAMLEGQHIETAAGSLAATLPEDSDMISNLNKDDPRVSAALIKQLMAGMKPPIIPVALQELLQAESKKETKDPAALKEGFNAVIAKMPAANRELLVEVLDGFLAARDEVKADTAMTLENLCTMAGPNLFVGLETKDPSEMLTITGVQNYLAKLLLDMRANKEITKESEVGKSDVEQQSRDVPSRSPAKPITIQVAPATLNLDREDDGLGESDVDDASSETKSIHSVSSGHGSVQSSPSSSIEDSAEARVDVAIPSTSPKTQNGREDKSGNKSNTNTSFFKRLFSGRNNGKVGAVQLQSGQQQGIEAGGDSR